MTEQEYLDRINPRFLDNDYEIILASIRLALIRDDKLNSSFSSSWDNEKVDENYYNNNIVFVNSSDKPSYADIQNAETTIRGLI